MPGVGDTLYGFCNGYFGRDSYVDKTIISIGKHRGHRWVVVSEYTGRLAFASGFSEDELTQWAQESERP